MDQSLEDNADGQISAARLAALLRGSTYATLLVEHRTTVVPLRDIAKPYLGTSVERAQVMANRGELELPVFRLGNQRSPWLVHLYDLAQHIDTHRAGAGSTAIYEEEVQSCD